MYRIIKRLFDFILAGLLFIIIIPFFVVLMVVVFFSVGHPIFFTQIRSGKNRRRFRVVKFRTMTDKKDENGVLLPDEQRVTKVGRFMRSTSIDELPELFNIISGKMSIIGPRPLPPEYDEYYKDEELIRFRVRPGLIPPDSLDETAFISWDDQFRYESEYAKKLKFGSDVKIFFHTFRMLFKRSSDNYGGYSRKPLCEERKNGVK